MGVQFNIKDAETVRKTRELAQVSGRSMTEVVRAAIDREWREREERRVERIGRATEIVAQIQPLLPDAWRGKTTKQIMDEMYDDDGLPI